MNNTDKIKFSIGPVTIVGPEENVTEIIDCVAEGLQGLDEFTNADLRDAILGYMLMELHKLSGVKSIREFVLHPFFSTPHFLTQGVLGKLMLAVMRNPEAEF